MEELEKLYDKREALMRENNDLVSKGFAINETIYELKKQRQTAESMSKMTNLNTQLSAINKKVIDTKLPERIKKIRQDIAALEKEIYGKPLSDSSPRTRNPRPS